MKLSNIINLSSVISQVPAASASFSTPVLIGDFPEVPVDVRYRTVTEDTSATVMDTTAAASAWCGDLWGQDYNLSSAYMARWVSTATSPRFVMTDCATSATPFVGITVGDLAITDGTSTEQLTTGSFAAATTLADVLAIVQTGVRASSTFAADMSAAVVSVDPTGRPYLESADTGSAATTYSIIAPTGGAGTDITTSGLLNIASRAFVVSGVDAEGLDDALAAVKGELADYSFFVVCCIGGSATQRDELATACAAYKYVLALDVKDSNAADASATTDEAYLINAASNSWTYMVYTEHTTDYPSAALIGQIMPAAEGSKNFALNAISSINESGLGADGSAVIALSDAKMSALDAKGCDYVGNLMGTNCFINGLLASGLQANVRVGLAWAEYRSAVEMLSYLLVNDITVYSDTDIQALAGCVFRYLDILVARNCLSSYTTNVPLASSISDTIKATHGLSMPYVASAIAAYAINSVTSTIKVQA